MTLTLRIAVAAASIISGVLHYDIWANHGYRAAPVKELFILQAAAAVIAGIVVLAPRAIAAAPALLVSAASLVAFALSRTVGVPTLHGTFDEAGLQPKAAQVLGVSSALIILIVEAIAVIAAGLILSRRQVPAQ